jgi:preprotein translocase subunit SecE
MTVGATGDSHGAVASRSRNRWLKKPVPVRKKPERLSKKRFVDKGIQFLREVKGRTKESDLATRKQTMGSTVVVFILVIISLFWGGRSWAFQPDPSWCLQ